MILVAVGANVAGTFGDPEDTLTILPNLLLSHAITPLVGSHVYVTASLSADGQGDYLNAVMVVDTVHDPRTLLSQLKRIEYIAGRRSGPRWGERPLDLDLLAYHDIVCRFSRTAPQMADDSENPHMPQDLDLVLPHPAILDRPFVIRPLLDVVPDWRHPVMQKTVRRIWRSVSRVHHGRVLTRHAMSFMNKV